MSDIKDLRARYTTSGNAVIPNTFQHPNIFIDKLMYYLTPEENVVLTFAVRRILGFQTNIMSRKDNISLSQFVDGITASDGSILCHGCGLGTDSVRKALEALCLFKVLVPTTEKPDPRKGQEYWLQDNENIIDWAALEARKSAKKQIEYQRTEKARCTVAQQGTVGQKARGTVAQKARVLSHSNTKPTETHGNPNNGAQNAPLTPGLSIENQIYLGADTITMPTDDQEKKAQQDMAVFLIIQKGNADLEGMARAFIETRGLFPTTKKEAKRWATLFREMKVSGGTPEHVKAAVLELAHKNWTCADPSSVRKMVISAANPMPETPVLTLTDAAL